MVNMDAQEQAELAKAQQLSKYNDSIKYILKVIAMLFKHSWDIGLKSKTDSETVCAFKASFSRGTKSLILQSDRTL